MATYLIIKDKGKVRKTTYDDLSSSVNYWERCKQESKEDKVKVNYRTETVNGYKRVYYVYIRYPGNEVWEYYLKSSAKNKYIFKN